MGSSVSTTITKAEEAIGNSGTDQANVISDSTVSAEELQILNQIKGLPKYVQPETFEQKLYRKVSRFNISR